MKRKTHLVTVAKEKTDSRISEFFGLPNHLPIRSDIFNSIPVYIKMVFFVNIVFILFALIIAPSAWLHG